MIVKDMCSSSAKGYHGYHYKKIDCTYKYGMHSSGLMLLFFIISQQNKN